MLEIKHKPVLLDKVKELLCDHPRKVFVDCTLGEGGHTEGILSSSSPDSIVVGIDQDEDVIDKAILNLKRFQNRLILRYGSFDDISEILRSEGIEKVDGILIDLGISSFQLDDSQRGFSFLRNGPLDMRMDQRGDIKAYDIVNKYSLDELISIIKGYGEERWAKRIAENIVTERANAPILTTSDLVEIISRSVPKKYKVMRIHPATRTFQALRITLNRELDKLKNVIPISIDLLNKGGRLCIISYHSLEDRIVKQMFREYEKGCHCPPDFPECVCGVKGVVKIITRKSVVPDEEEIKYNPRSRSARLRVIEKI